MIGIYQFAMLNSTDQAQTVWTEGTHISSRAVRQKKYNLYALGNFYVEVLYDSRDHEVKKIKSFKSERLLKPYLSQITLKL